MGARLIVEKDALIRNYLKLRETCGVEVIPVLKSNAYGLGLLQAAGIYVELGAKRIAVSRVGEAELLSNYGCEAELILLSSSDLRSDIFLARLVRLRHRRPLQLVFSHAFF